MGSPVGDYWVIDRNHDQHSDCWIYWASPLKPGEATGLLLDKVVKKDWAYLNRIGSNFDYNQDYYYGINVVAQMATKDGTTDSNGVIDNYIRFGDAANGGWSADGQKLMEIVVGS